MLDAQDNITQHGVAYLDGLCPDTFIGHIDAASQSRSRDVMAALAGKEIGIGSAAGYDEVVQRSPGRWDIPISPEDFGVQDRNLPWWPLVTAILGDDAEHSFSGVVFSEPDTPAQHWHTDSPHLLPEHLPAHALNVLVALHDIPLEMGPTEFARGSHLLTNHLGNPALVADELIYQHATTTPAILTDEPLESEVHPLTAGSCIIFDDRIMHRGLANRSALSRRVAYFSYRCKGYTANTHFESQRSLFA